MGSDGDPVTWDGQDLVLTLRVTPGASREEFVADGELLRVRVQVPPQDGKANKRLGKLLGKAFGVPQSAVIVERGHTSRTKTIRVQSPSRLPPFIKEP